MLKRIVFWVDILSVHQAPLIRAVQERSGCPVYVFTQSATVGKRGNQGWKIPDFGGAIVEECATVDTAIALASDVGVGAVNIFTGLGSYEILTSASKFLSKTDEIIIHQSERWNPQGYRGVGRRFLYRARKRHINDNQRSSLLAMGELGVKAFRSVGVDSDKVYEFGYFTDANLAEIGEGRQRHGAVYVGSLTKRKRVDLAVGAALEEESVEKLSIIGVGPLRADLERQAAPCEEKIDFLGTVPNKQICADIAKHKLLILPSAFDGWGAVVNEALLAGTPVVCSDTVGAASLISSGGPERGLTFRSGDGKALRGALAELAKAHAAGAIDYGEIQSWAGENLSPVEGADYLLAVAEITGGTGKKRPNLAPPWRR